MELDPAFAKETDALAKVVMDRFLTWLASSSDSSKRLGPDSSSSYERTRYKSLLEHIAVGQQTPSGEDDTIIVELPWLDPPVYAGPFYVEDPVQNIHCLTRTNLHTIEVLKHHLWNSHRQPPFCPTCGTEFSRFNERDDISGVERALGSQQCYIKVCRMSIGANWPSDPRPKPPR